MTAAFAPAPQLIFDPRPVLAVVPEPQPEAAGVVVPWPNEARTLPMAVIYRRRRVLALAVLALVAGVVLGVGSFVGSADATLTPEARSADSTVIIVQPGDTLWDIARSLEPEGDPGELAAALADIAGSADVEVGQQIVVPGSLLD